MSMPRGTFRGWLYQSIMRLAHKHNWHHAPPLYPDGDTQLWCQWCGFRQTIKFAPKRSADYGEPQEAAQPASGESHE